MTDSAVTADFFEIPGATREAALCEKVSSFYEEGERIYLIAESEAAARKLDELLWTFRDNSFVPHSLWSGEKEPLEEPVAVGWSRGNPNGAQRLVVAGPVEPGEVVASSGLFRAIADFIPKGNEAATAEARIRYKALRDAGIQPSHHPLGGQKEKSS